jgi:hypothetical protein
MACAGCGQKFLDKGGTVSRSTYYRICYGCMSKALELEPAHPEELLKLYQHLVDNGICIAQSLLDEQLSEAAARYLDPADRMFNPRGE